ncbi:hypothetical protein E3A20_15230 [Planctomyces bekefii]|uniref:GIY-YIG domain-containing protein n=1 Tax=Planctomyces bekefii TaxID=1653850 RepID=A0A5C6M4Y0_9PLAN|nr:hypothetical protein E3A20_15230 [Planctomyces bekefii]
MYYTLNQLYPNRIITPQNVNEIQNRTWYVYILTYENRAIVVGQGKRNRAKVIFDNVNIRTDYHYKSLLVRLYRLFGNGVFNQFLITCNSRDESKIIEKELHREIGGKGTVIENDILEILFQNIERNSSIWAFLKIALLSSYSGLSDLKKWRKGGIINDLEWQIITDKLQIEY